MERRLKERLTGAAVLVTLAVIFIPMILDNSNGNYTKISESNIPPKPDTNFRSRIIPVEETPVRTQSIPADLSQALEDENTISDEVETKPLAISTASTRTQAPPPKASTNIAESPPLRGTIPLEPRGLTAWVVQLGSFSNEENAKGLVLRLQSSGYPAYIEEITGDSGPIFRVRVGPELSKADAEVTLKDLDEKFALKGILISYP